MSEILPGIHLIDGLPSHAYLVRDGPKSTTWTLVDTSFPGTAGVIEEYLRSHGIAPGSVRSIVLTHLHKDHTGNLQHLAGLTGASTYGHWIEAAYIGMHPKYDGPGMPPDEPFEIAHRFKDGDRIDAGGGLVAYHTPGHTPGHTAYYLPDRKVLFAGDLLFGHGAKLLLTTPEYTHHTLTAQISARRIAELPIESVLTHHGGPYPSGGGALLRELVTPW